MDDLPIVDPYGDEFKDSAQANAPRHATRSAPYPGSEPLYDDYGPPLLDEGDMRPMPTYGRRPVPMYRSGSWRKPVYSGHGPVPYGPAPYGPAPYRSGPRPYGHGGYRPIVHGGVSLDHMPFEHKSSIMRQLGMPHYDDFDYGYSRPYYHHEQIPMYREPVPMYPEPVPVPVRPRPVVSYGAPNVGFAPARFMTAPTTRVVSAPAPVVTAGPRLPYSPGLNPYSPGLNPAPAPAAYAGVPPLSYGPSYGM